MDTLRECVCARSTPSSTVSHKGRKWWRFVLSSAGWWNRKAVMKWSVSPLSMEPLSLSHWANTHFVSASLMKGGDVSVHFIRSPRIFLRNTSQCVRRVSLSIHKVPSCLFSFPETSIREVVLLTNNSWPEGNLRPSYSWQDFGGQRWRIKFLAISLSRIDTERSSWCRFVSSRSKVKVTERSNPVLTRRFHTVRTSWLCVAHQVAPTWPRPVKTSRPKQTVTSQLGRKPKYEKASGVLGGGLHSLSADQESRVCWRRRWSRGCHHGQSPPTPPWNWALWGAASSTCRSSPVQWLIKSSHLRCRPVNNVNKYQNVWLRFQYWSLSRSNFQ